MAKEENLHWLNREIETWESECKSKHPIKEALYAARKALEREPCSNCIEFKRYAKQMGFELEQEPVLDKVRAEIKAMSGDIETIADVLQIIDNCRTESEGKE